MSMLTPIQQSFSAGEISPLASGRVDTEGYQQGVAELLNLFPDSRGPAISRVGYAFDKQFNGDKARIFNISKNSSSEYAITLLNLAMEIGLPPNWGSPTSFVTVYPEADLPTVQIVESPDGNEIYFLHKNHPPYKLTYDRVLDSFSWAVVTFTSKPAVWTGSNYPSTGDFFEGRFWLGGTPNEPQTFWASVSGSPENFTMGSLPADALTFTLAKRGIIVWMVGFKNLLIGTQNGEHIVTSEGGLITPSDIHVTQQSSYGSAEVQPVLIGDQVFYVSSDRRKLRAIQYQWQEDNWLSKDLTFTSEHITGVGGIIQLAWQQNPNNLLQCVLADGNVAVLIYERGHNIYGWGKYNFAGTVLDVTIAVIDGISRAYATIQYASGKINVEVQSLTEYFMDSWIEVAPAGDLVSGLTHLEGVECQVLLDGAVQPNATVVSGQITLQVDTGTLAVVGRQFIRRLKTLPADFGSQTGSAGIWTKRWNKLFVRILNSARPLINGKRPPTRDPDTPMDEVEPLLTESVQVSNLGHSKEAQITIEQDLPLDLKILGVFGNLSQEKP